MRRRVTLLRTAGWQWAAMGAGGMLLLNLSRRATPGDGGRGAARWPFGLLRHGSGACRRRSHRDSRSCSVANRRTRLAMPADFVLWLLGAAVVVLLGAPWLRRAFASGSAERRLGFWAIPAWSSRPASAGCSLLDLSANGPPGNRYLALYHQGHLWLGMLAFTRRCIRAPAARTLALMDAVPFRRPGEQRRRKRGSAAPVRRAAACCCAARAGRRRRVAAAQPPPAHVRNRPPVAHRRRGLVLLPARHAVHRAALRGAAARSHRSLRYVRPLLFVVDCAGSARC